MASQMNNKCEARCVLSSLLKLRALAVLEEKHWRPPHRASQSDSHSGSNKI
jgi:hypothetical protein